MHWVVQVHVTLKRPCLEFQIYQKFASKFSVKIRIYRLHEETFELSVLLSCESEVSSVAQMLGILMCKLTEFWRKQMACSIVLLDKIFTLDSHQET